VLKAIPYPSMQKKTMFFSRTFIFSRKNKKRKEPRNYKVLVEDFEIKVFSN